jgi:hypothetical protein
VKNILPKNLGEKTTVKATDTEQKNKDAWIQYVKKNIKQAIGGFSQVEKLQGISNALKDYKKAIDKFGDKTESKNVVSELAEVEKAVDVLTSLYHKYK